MGLLTIYQQGIACLYLMPCFLGKNVVFVEVLYEFSYLKSIACAPDSVNKYHINDKNDKN